MLLNVAYILCACSVALTWFTIHFDSRGVFWVFFFDSPDLNINPIHSTHSLDTFKAVIVELMLN